MTERPSIAEVGVGRNVSPSTTARWIAQNNLGHKLPGYKGQWIVDGGLFEEFLQQIIKLL